ncbi:phytanoyl-CoA dioxygenase family protein [Nonomuraea sp. NPDC050691]|uniref:phytanoyl-CoA dioxygenase family protein n=1 Tax=Nonomuraea sp. NPDC050691 TaxID=3155661 RepID=UPI0033E739EB
MRRTAYAFGELFGLLRVLRFLPVRVSYFRKLRPARATSSVTEHVTALRRDGVVIIPDFLDAETIARMRTAVPDPAEFDESPEGDGALRYPKAAEIEAFAPFFDEETVPSIVRGYLSRTAEPVRRTVGLKVRTGPIPTFETSYHIDTWKLRVKAWLYLEDVGPENAPTVYLKGSHRGAWRLLHEARHHDWFRVDEEGFADEDVLYVGALWPHEVARLRAAYGFEEVVCTGRAGTLLLFDGRGLHHATTLESGRRLILTSYWVHPDA